MPTLWLTQKRTEWIICMNPVLYYLTKSDTRHSSLGWIMMSWSPMKTVPGRADSTQSRKQKPSQLTYILPRPSASHTPLPPAQLVTHHHANTASGTQELERHQMIKYAHFHINTHTLACISSLSHIHRHTQWGNCCFEFSTALVTQWREGCINYMDLS